MASNPPAKCCTVGVTHEYVEARDRAAKQQTHAPQVPFADTAPTQGSPDRQLHQGGREV